MALFPFSRTLYHTVLYYIIVASYQVAGEASLTFSQLTSSLGEAESRYAQSWETWDFVVF